MYIYPAIDLRGGKAVRLTKGDYDKMNIYSDNPAEIALGFQRDGARFLHLVDLDGAKEGSPVNFETIREIVSKTDMFVEVGGGIRTLSRIKEYIDLGVNRIIIGTAAITNFPLVLDAVSKYGDKVAVGVDTKDGKISVNGWLETTDTDGCEFCEKLYKNGVKTVIYTDISKDGMMQGTNIEIYKRLSQIKGLNIIASGGISYIYEIKELNEMGTYGAILGKALYENKLDLKDAIKTAEGKA